MGRVGRGVSVTLLHILTACSRPGGLAAIADALSAAPSGLDLRWHVGFDLARRHIGGQAVKNALLDGIDDGWVWVCDDDNLPAPGFLYRLAVLLGDDACDGYLFGQLRPGGYVPPVPPALGVTDVAQVVLRRRAIGAHRLPAQYDGDGHWICAIWRDHPGRIALVDEALTLYNAQEWRS